MFIYLIRDLEHYGVATRDRSEIAELHGADGELEGVTLRSGERLAFSFLFLFLGALPCTDWLADVVARGQRPGFILTGTNAGGESLLETSIPGVFAAGDVRKRLPRSPSGMTSRSGSIDGSRRDRPRRQLRDSVTHGQVSGSSSSPAP